MTSLSFKLRIKKLRAGKVQPKPVLDPFKLKGGQAGYLLGKGSGSDDSFQVVAATNNAVKVRCKQLWTKRLYYGSSGGFNAGNISMRRSVGVPVVKYSPPFWIEGLTGIAEETIQIPLRIWYVQPPKNGKLVLLPVTAPLKPRAAAKKK